MSKTTVNKIVWGCDRCGHTEDAEICGATDARFPEGWGLISIKGKQQHLCKGCNESLSKWFEMTRGAPVTQRRVPPSEPFTKS